MGVQNPNERPIKLKAKPKLRVVKVAAEVTRPVTKAQRKAITKGVVKAQRDVAATRFAQKAIKTAGRVANKRVNTEGATGSFSTSAAYGRPTHHLAYMGGDPLTGVNQVFHIAASGANKLLGGSPKIVRNAAKEIIDSPAQAVPATVMAATHPKLVVKQIEQTVKHPGKALRDQPVTTLLLLRGGIAGVGRGAGAIARTGALGKAVKGAASIERTPLKLAVGGEHQQSYSKDVTVKVAQKAGEKSKRVQEYRAKRFTNRRIDRTVGTNEGIRRVERDRARVTVTRAKPKHGHDAVTLVNEGVLKHPKTVERDLHQELERLQAERRTLREPHDLKQNNASIEAVQRLQKDRGFLQNPEAAFTAARTFSRSQKPVTTERVHYGDLNKTQAEQRIVAPHAIREMGLRYDEGGEQIFDRAASLKAIQRHNRKVETKKPKMEYTRYSVRKNPGRAGGEWEVWGEGHVRASENFTSEKAARVYAEKHNRFGTPKGGEYQRFRAPAKVRGRLPAQETTTAGFRTAAGKTVSTREILKDFKAKGGDPRNLAYVPETSTFKGSKNMYLATSRRPMPERQVFKGVNTKGGLYERDYGVLEHQAAKAQGKVSAHQGVDRIINDYGHTKPGGKLFSWDEAQKEILNQQTATGQRYVPLQVLRGQHGEAAARIKEGLHPSELPQMFRPAEKGDGNIVLLPETVAKRIQAHENIGSKVPLVKVFQSVNQRFRHAVLPTSPRWAVGNITEMMLRMAVEDPTLFKSIASGKHLESALKAVGGQQAVDRLRSAAGAGHIGAQSKFDIYRPPESEIVKAVHALRQVHGPKEVANAWDLYKKAVFGANTRAENLIYYAGLGKEAAREVQGITGAWHKTLDLGGKAYQDVAKGLTQTDNIERYARAIDDMRGRYSNLSPLARSATLTFTPFAPWYINALHFVFVTLPVKHPIKTALLGQVVESQRKKLEALGITHFPTAGTKPMPAYLLGRIPLKGGGLLPAAQYLPFGAFTDVGGNLASVVLPQVSGALENLQGQSFTGHQLMDAKGHPIEAGDPRTVLIALNTIAESFVPFLRHGRQIREKGGSPADTSTIFSPKTKKSNPSKDTVEGVKRAFNPFYVAGNKAQTAKGPFDHFYKAPTSAGAPADYSHFYK